MTSEISAEMENHKNFTFNQIQELMTDYGSIDILWLDGGEGQKRL